MLNLNYKYNANNTTIKLSKLPTKLPLLTSSTIRMITGEVTFSTVITFTTSMYFLT